MDFYDRLAPAYALITRNDPNEQENVVFYDPTLESEPKGEHHARNAN